MDEFVVVGLGNPGSRYVLTRHNVGFLFIDEFLRKYRLTQIAKREKYISYVVQAEGLIFQLIRPLTFMNLSGQIFRELQVDVPPLIVHDDIDLPLGRIRIRPGGSSGGHKGVKSIIESLGTEEIPRIRIGIGPKLTDAVEFVLGRFTNDELKIMDKIINLCVEATITIAKEGIKTAMNKYNSISMKVI